MQERCAVCGTVQEISEWHDSREVTRAGTFICDRCSQRIQNDARDLQKR